jgi:hypothetical protein
LIVRLRSLRACDALALRRRFPVVAKRGSREHAFGETCRANGSVTWNRCFDVWFT